MYVTYFEYFETVKYGMISSEIFTTNRDCEIKEICLTYFVFILYCNDVYIIRRNH